MPFTVTRLIEAKRIAIEERSLPATVPEGHVRLRLATASLCGTDLHYYRNFANAGFELQRPITLGHEAAVHVDDAAGSGLAAGQLVALNPIIACGRCPACLEGKVNFCANKRFPGSATTVPHIDGFFQASFDFPITCCQPVSGGVDPDHVTFTEPLACALHAVRKGGIGGGTKALITGCGPMGLLSVVAARGKGALVEAVDVRSAAAALAKSLGAAEAHLSDAPALAKQAGTFDVVVEASGNPSAFNQALDLVRRQGRIVILSNIQRSATPIDLHRIMLKEIEVVGSFQYDREFAEALEMIETGAVDLEPLIAARFDLDQAADAFALMDSGGAAGKILLKNGT